MSYIPWPAGTGPISFAGDTAPSGWLLCDGSEYNRTTYADLFAAVGTKYGAGNGTTTFNVPDCRQRIPLGKYVGANLGDTGGAFNHTHTSVAHTHTVAAHTYNGPSHTHTGTTDNTDIQHAHGVSGTTSNENNDVDLTAASFGSDGAVAAGGFSGGHQHVY